MPLNVQVDKGGEKYLAFAKKKLAEMKDMMKRAKVGALSRWFQVGAHDRIWINSCTAGRDQTLDWIKIISGSPIRYLWAGDLVHDFSGGSVVSDTYPAGGQSWYANPSPPPNYAAFTTGTQPPGWVGVGTAFQTTYTHRVIGLVETNGFTRSGLNDGPNVVVAAENTVADTPFNTDGYGESLIDVGPSDTDIRALLDAGHPVPPEAPPTLADGELITVVRLAYSYTGELSESRTDEFFTSSAGGAADITAVHIRKATQFLYHRDTDSWEFVKDVPFKEEATLDADTVTYYGNVVFVSEKPIQGQNDGMGNTELDATYQAQEDALNMDGPFDILRFVKQAIYG